MDAITTLHFIRMHQWFRIWIIARSDTQRMVTASIFLLLMEIYRICIPVNNFNNCCYAVADVARVILDMAGNLLIKNVEII